MCLNIAVEYRDSKCCVIRSVLVSLSVVVHGLTIMNSKNVKNGWSGGEGGDTCKGGKETRKCANSLYLGSFLQHRHGSQTGL